MNGAARDPGRRSQRRAARARRLEPQADAPRRVAHADRMREAHRVCTGRQLGRRDARARPEPEKLYTWWSYRAPDWETANKGRRLDQSGGPCPRRPRVDIAFSEARGWDAPSDHVPVTATIEVRGSSSPVRSAIAGCPVLKACRIPTDSCRLSGLRVARNAGAANGSSFRHRGSRHLPHGAAWSAPGISRSLRGRAAIELRRRYARSG